MAGRSNPTAGSTRRRFTATMRRSGTVLQKFLAGKSGEVLEAGSGTGQHVVHFARHTPDIVWWPSDLNERHLKSIEAWRAHTGLPNIRPPLRIDLTDPAWCPQMHDGSGPGKLLAVFCANVIHIAPWRVAEGLFAGAARYLRADGRLFLYGPFKRDGKHTAMSNAVFDTSLREQDAEWGVRDIADVEKLADGVGLSIGGNARHARQQHDSGVSAIGRVDVGGVLHVNRRRGTSPVRAASSARRECPGRGTVA